MTARLLNFTNAVTNDKIELHDGDLVLYKRDSVNGTRQFRLKLPDGSHERKTTGERDKAKAQKVAEDWWLDVRWRGERALRVATFRCSRQQRRARPQATGHAGWQGYPQQRREENRTLDNRLPPTLAACL